MVQVGSLFSSCAKKKNRASCESFEFIENHCLIAKSNLYHFTLKEIFPDSSVFPGVTYLGYSNSPAFALINNSGSILGIAGSHFRL